MKIGYKCIVKLYFTVAGEKMKWYNQKHDPHNGKSAGEQVAGFKDLRTGRFSEIMLIRNNKDLDEFLGKYDISPEEVTKEY